jgi:hypothetical protein
MLMLLHVLVLVGVRRLLFLLEDGVLLLMCGGLLLGVLPLPLLPQLLLVVPLLPVVWVLHVGSLRLLVLFAVGCCGTY